MSAQELVEDIGGAFDEVREEFFGADAKLLLLKTDGAVAPYAVLEIVTSGWVSEFDGRMGVVFFNVARIDEDFNKTVEDAAFLVVLDSDLSSLNNRLHAIDRETVRPAGAEPFWQIGARPNGRRYTPA